MGTPKFAVPSFLAIIEAGYRIELVITQPDRPKGRGLRLISSPIKEIAMEYHFPILAPQSIKDTEVIDRIRYINPDVIVVVAYGQILPPMILESARYGCVNLHASLLPKYRGPAPVAWAIINGEQETGVTTIFMNERVDEGDIIFQKKISILPEDTRGSLEEKLATLGAELLIETLEAIESGTAPRIPQDHSLATYAPMLKDTDAVINWILPAEKIINFIRGLAPLPGAHTYLGKMRIRILEATLLENEIKTVLELRETSQPGKIIYIGKKKRDLPGIVVTTGTDPLLLKTIQPEGKKIMSALDFSHGYRLQVGDKFFIPPAS